WIDLVGTGTAGQKNHAISQWSNETGYEISIRDVQLSAQYKSTGGNQDCRAQLSKQNQYINADGDRNWKVHLPVSSNESYTTGDDSIPIGAMVSKKYGIGQVTVEPGETLYLHDEQETVQDERIRAIVGYSLNK
ncbi:hypothetical protein KA005_37360, partial [bacterium]|nr:hypothetical protein [bacterium]